jgi:hypothetical protein
VLLLAAALEAALPDVPEDDRPATGELAVFPWWEFAGARRRRLADLIGFFRQGGFQAVPPWEAARG